MDDNTRKEIVRELELDYERTTKVAWPLSASSSFSCSHFVDGYRSWLYAKVLQQANNIETIMPYYYAFLARGDVDPQAKRDFEVKIESHCFGLFGNQ